MFLQTNNVTFFSFFFFSLDYIWSEPPTLTGKQSKSRIASHLESPWTEAEVRDTHAASSLQRRCHSAGLWHGADTCRSTWRVFRSCSFYQETPGIWLYSFGRGVTRALLKVQLCFPWTLANCLPLFTSSVFFLLSRACFLPLTLVFLVTDNCLAVAFWLGCSDGVSSGCRRSPAGDPPTGPRHRWKPRCRTSRAGSGVSWRWQPGCRGTGAGVPWRCRLGVGGRGRGFPGVADWVSGVPWCWRPGCRGFPGVGGLGVGGSLALTTGCWGTWVPWCWRPGCRGSGVPWCWRPGGRGFHGVGDLGVAGSGVPWCWRPGCLLAVPHCFVAPTRSTIKDWIITLVTLLTALSASDTVWTCRDAMASLQAPGARCPLWVGPRLFLVIQAMASLRAPGARCPLWVGPRLFLVIQGARWIPRSLLSFPKAFQGCWRTQTAGQSGLLSVSRPYFWSFLLPERISTHTLVWLMLSQCPSRQLKSECPRSILLWPAPPLRYHLSRWFILFYFLS